jgi:1,4-alpha-glucan branching enzyme
MAKKASTKSNSDTEGNSLLTDFDVHLFKTGKHFKLYEKLGAHLTSFGNKKGVYFAVWAPNAKAVSVIGNFNDWSDSKNRMNPRWDESGIWEVFIPGCRREKYISMRSTQTQVIT